MSGPVKIVAMSVAVLFIAAGCSTSSDEPTAVASASPTASPSPVGITEDAWVAALDPDSLDAAVALLVEPGVETVIDAQDDDGMTALLYAATAGDADAVAALLDAGADPLVRTRSGLPVRSAIHIAAAQGDVEVLQVLLDHGVDVNAPDGANGHALLWAAYKGQSDAVALLLAAGADTELVDGSGMNAAERAERAGFTDVANTIYAAMPSS